MLIKCPKCGVYVEPVFDIVNDEFGERCIYRCPACQSELTGDDLEEALEGGEDND